MTKKVLKSTELGSEIKMKAKTVTVKGTITDSQRQSLQKLIGVIGSNEQDVVGKILTLWLYNEGFLDIKIKNSEDLNVLKGINKK